MTTRSKAIAGLASVFLLGGVCGALIVGVVLRDNVREAQRLRDRDGFLDYFEKKLELTEQQRDSLRDVLNEAYQKLATLRVNASERYNEVIDTLKQRMYPQLTEVQRARFTEEEAKFRRFMPRESASRLSRREVDGMPAAPAASGSVAGAPATRDSAGRTSASGAIAQGSNRPAEGVITPTNPRRDSTAHQPRPVVPDPAALRPNDNADAEPTFAPDSTIRRLNLTPDQARQLKTLKQQTNNELRAIAQTYRDDVVTFRQMKRAKVIDARTKFRAILTPEQLVVLKQMQAERRRMRSGQ